MSWIVFSSQDDALAAEQRIRSNVLSWAQEHMPERVHPSGGLIGVNAATGALDAAAAPTTAWAIPQEYVEGWAIPAPTEEQIAPIPIDVFLGGVGGTVVDAVALLPQPEEVPV